VGTPKSICLLVFVASLGAQTPTPDRVVAEWMLRMGGSVNLHGERRALRDLTELPVTDFAIHTLNFTGVTQWGASRKTEMKRLPKLARVKELYVNGRLWYDQPVTLVASTMGMRAASTELDLLERMRSIPEGGGNVLDNTACVFVHEHAEANSHKCNGLAMLVAGGGIRGGVHAKAHNGIGDVYLTIVEEILKTKLEFPTAREKMGALV